MSCADFHISSVMFLCGSGASPILEVAQQMASTPAKLQLYHLVATAVDHHEDSWIPQAAAQTLEPSIGKSPACPSSSRTPAFCVVKCDNQRT